MRNGSNSSDDSDNILKKMQYSKSKIKETKSSDNNINYIRPKKEIDIYDQWGNDWEVKIDYYSISRKYSKMTVIDSLLIVVIVSDIGSLVHTNSKYSYHENFIFGAFD